MLGENGVIASHLDKEFTVEGGLPVPVLRDVSLMLAPGALTMLVGQSGCGKTTLLSILAGILSPTHGTVSLFGTTLSRLSDRAKVRFRREHLGFIFQQYNLLPALTASENAAIPLVAAGVPLTKACEQARAMLAQLGMAAHHQKYPRQLSGGQQQRVAIARALVHQPRFVVCDEPTAALDAETGQTVLGLLQEHAKSPNRCVLVVTHDSRIYPFADRILTMEDGQIIADTFPPV
jgi:putative ABC transport system ATP-binding protein